MSATAGITARPYAGVADLRRMQDAVSRGFGRGVYHVGDLAWAMRDHGHVQLSPLVTLLESPGGEMLGWTWFHLYGWFDAVPTAELDEALAGALVDAALDSARRCVDAGDAIEQLSTLWDEEDSALIGVLRQRGFSLLDAPFEVTRRSLDDLPGQRPLPDGLRLTHVSDDALVHARVECHRSAFPPSRATVSGFQRVRRTWPYREELDRVVVDEQGTVLSSCLAWIDEATGWGLLEPVGTRPEHQRRGLGTAVCLDALYALREAGATHAQVSCESGKAGCATYHGLGFATERSMGILRRPFTR